MHRHTLITQHLPVLTAALPLAGWALHARTLTRRLDAARRDPLTGLVTRDGFEQAATKALHRPDAAVAFVDLDRFKQINDTHGHAAGDHVITATAEALGLFAGVGGTAARLGGDEFAVITALPTGWTKIRMGRLAARLRNITWQNEALGVTASVGLCRIADLPTPSLPTALAAADAAMYQAKRNGGGTWVLAGPEHEHSPRRWARTGPATTERSAA